MALQDVGSVLQTYRAPHRADLTDSRHPLLRRNNLSRRLSFAVDDCCSATASIRRQFFRHLHMPFCRE